MTPKEEKQIAEWNNTLSQDIDIRLMLTADRRSGDFDRFGEMLCRIAPKVRIIRERDESESPPLIQIGRAVKYQAIPEGTELEPFLDALDTLDNKSVQLSAQIRERIREISVPADLRLYVSPQCPFCPRVTRQMISLVSASVLVRLTVTDGLFFPESAESDHIQSVPSLLLDPYFRWTGEIQPEEILEVLSHRDPADLSAAAMERMILEGNAFRLSELMLEKEMIFTAFPDLLVHELFSVRLGAMAAMEDIAEQNISLASTVAEPLLERFDRQNDQVRGDIIHILGEAGNSAIIPRLKEISKMQSDPEIHEAAAEAIEKIMQREKC